MRSQADDAPQPPEVRLGGGVFERVGRADGGRDGEEVTHYQPYSEKDSQLLEENFEASGFKATTALSLNGRK